RIAASVEPPMPVPMMATSYCCVIKFSPKLQRSVCHRETEFLGETRFLNVSDRQFTYTTLNYRPGGQAGAGGMIISSPAIRTCHQR
ncbi:MAG: hypothetical protein KDE24_36685, partial [Caldilinea sp.]|nr:hypothetical protein [Caldilinea sp.]